MPKKFYGPFLYIILNKPMIQASFGIATNWISMFLYRIYFKIKIIDITT